MGNGGKRPRPQTTQLGAWRVGNNLSSKIERKQALLAKERLHVSRKSQVNASIFSFSTSVLMEHLLPIDLCFYDPLLP
jgi:hypothetical protein